MNVFYLRKLLIYIIYIMIVNKRLNIRIYPNKEHEKYFDINFNACRFIYNYYLAQRTQNYLDGIKTKLKTEKELKIIFSFLKEADAIALQQTRRDLETAFDNYFRKLKEKLIPNLTPQKLAKLKTKIFKSEVNRYIAYHPCYPKFKSKNDLNQSFKTYINTKQKYFYIDNKNHKIKLPKIGWIKFRYSKDILINIKSVTISKTNCNEYYASLLYEEEIIEQEHINIQEKDYIGLDMSAKEFLIASNNETFTNQKFYRKNERRLKIRQRKLSKKQKGSKNREKQRLIVAKTHNKIVNQKDYYLHKVSKYLSDKYKVICIEDLNIKGMQKFSSGLSKTISLDLSFSKFITMLNYKMKWKNKYLVKVGRYFPSSKLCSNCGYINENLKLSERTWKCDCGVIHNRDKNASFNILNEGMKILEGKNLFKNSTEVHSESYVYGDMSG